MYYFDAATDLGLGAALVYRSDADEHRIASTAFWIGIIGRLHALRCSSGSSRRSSRSIGPDQETVWLLRVLSFQFPLSALGMCTSTACGRRLDFKRLMSPVHVRRRSRKVSCPSSRRPRARACGAS